MIAIAVTSIRTGFVRSVGVLLALVSLSLSCTSGPPNVAKGARCTVHPLPEYPLTCPPQNSGVLTDGVFTSGHFWTSRSTAGWEQSGPVEILMDLGEERAFSALRFSTARGTGGDVYYPAHVFVFAGNRPDRFAFIGDAAWDDANVPGPYETRFFSLTFPATSARYVFLRVIPQGEYLFCDEIELPGAPAGTPPQAGMSVDSVRRLSVRLKETALTARLLRKDVETLLRLNASAGKETDSLRAVSRRIGFSFPGEDGTRSLQVEARRLRAAIYRRDHPGSSLVALPVSPWIPLAPMEIPRGRAERQAEIAIPRGAVAHEGLFLLNIRPNGSPVKVNVQVRDTTVVRVRLFEADFITAADMIRTPDPLIPVAGEVVLAEGESKLVLVSMEGTAPGTSGVVVRVSNEDTVVTIERTIGVLPISMPGQSSLRILTWSYLDYPLIANRRDEALQDLRRHYTNVVVVPPSYLVEAECDHASFRKRLLGYLRAHAGFESVLLYLEFRDQQLLTINNRFGYLSPQWQSWFTRWFRIVMEAVHEAGFDSSRVFLYPFDEMRGGEIDQFIQLASWAKRAVPGAKFYATIDKASAARVLPHLAVAQFMEKPGLNSLPDVSGLEVWRYILLGKSVPPYAGVRLMMWRAFVDGVSGLGFWNYADIGWGDKNEGEWNDSDGTRADYNVVYRQGPGPLLSSRRWEAWRTGIEDYEILRVYTAKYGMQAARALARTVVDAPENTDRADVVRALMLRELVSTRGKGTP